MLFRKSILSSLVSVVVLAGCEVPLIDQNSTKEERFTFSIKSPSYRSYDPNPAVSYAKNNYDLPYGSQNPFHDYPYSVGGNCTNFASQAIIAGLTGETSPNGVYNRRKDFIADANSPYAWFFIKDGTPSSTTRGKAWTGANDLYQYAKSNKSTYRGLHFQYITNDSPTSFMDYKQIKKGDIIFADWEGDGHIDHTMIVTDTQFDSWSWSIRGYDRIRVTYQTYNKTDVGLGFLNELYKYKALFYVYRPTDYNPNGK